MSAATRADFATAAVLTGECHEGAVYELGGDEAFTMAERAAEISRQSGSEVVYRDLPADEYETALVDAGVTEPFAAVLVDSDRVIARGHFFVETGDLRRLIGRPTTPLADADAVADVLQN